MTSYRLLLTSYEKSGTHMAMQMFMHEIPNIVDRSGMNMKGLGDYGYVEDRPLPTVERTIERLRNFPRGKRKAFGHIGYLPEYVEAIQSTPTKVVFNVRDPRDVVVSEWMNLVERVPEDAREGRGWMNLRLPTGVQLFDCDDPIAELIKIAAIRWPNWLGWLDEDFVTMLKFEELRYHPNATIARMRKALVGCPLPPEPMMLRQAQDSGWSATFRKGVGGEWKTTFTDEHKELADELLTPIMERLGYA